MSTTLQDLAVYSICVLLIVLLSWHFVFRDRELQDNEADHRPQSSLVFAQENDVTTNYELATIQLPEPAVIWDHQVFELKTT
jgi:hypothetical protein